jgi:hypothetical protein
VGVTEVVVPCRSSFTVSLAMQDLPPQVEETRMPGAYSTRIAQTLLSPIRG